jgi:hypothetical protein
VTWPNFFVAGAQKAGTTSVYEFLRQHPEVFMSPVKEPGYFKFDPDAAVVPGHPAETADLARYLDLFADVRGERAIGEASASYLNHVHAATRIRAAVPDARVVVVLREPVERAYSSYSMRVAEGTEDRTFAEVVDAELDRAHRERIAGRWHYVGAGLYGRHLQRYYDRFPGDRIDVHLYEDLVRDPVGLVRSVYGFLGVDPGFTPSMAEHNVTRYAVRSASVDRMVRGFPGKSRLRSVVPSATWARMRRSVRRLNRARPGLGEAARARLAEFYRDDVRHAESLIGRDLSGWLEGEAADV